MALVSSSGVDIIILLSWDGDFDLLLKIVHHEYGMTTEAYGISKFTVPLQ
jgi:uncharacterized LabA/DUF88 family protein